MNKQLCWAALGIVLGASPVLAQANVTVTANPQAGSISDSASVAAAQGGNVSISSNTPAETVARSRINQRLVTPPSVVAPSLSAAGLETCLGSVSGGVSVMGGGASFGSSVKDDDCNRRLYARQLWNMGFRQAATLIQCLSPEVQYAMAAAGTPCFGGPPPVPGPIPSAGVSRPRAYGPTSAVGRDQPGATAVAVQRRSDLAPTPAPDAAPASAPAVRTAYAELSEEPASVKDEVDFFGRSSN